jgi:hypothetical protein
MPRPRVRPQFAPQDHRRHEHRGMRRYGVDAASGTHKHSAGPVTGASGAQSSNRLIRETKPYELPLRRGAVAGCRGGNGSYPPVLPVGRPFRHRPIATRTCGMARSRPHDHALITPGQAASCRVSPARTAPSPGRARRMNRRSPRQPPCHQARRSARRRRAAPSRRSGAAR